MSLFKSRDWWEINLNEHDSFDSQCLLTLTLDNDEFESILIGSHGGYLRLFSPSVKIVDGCCLSGYQPSHLLLELKLSAPILQISEGILVSGSDKKQVAVLHPRLFSVYAIKRTANEAGVGDQVSTQLVYQHVLRHSAHSFALGFFGGVRGRHFISILSLDGLLSFYEQESFAFQVYLPNFLLSFGLTYLEKSDSFIFLSGFLTFDCYSYEALASAVKEKKIIKTWDYQIGEAVLDVQTVSKNGFIIIVLSERNLRGLNENGCLLFAKRLEYTPLTFCSYLTEEEKKLMILIATDGQHINLYEETQLKWSMKIGQRPVCLKRVFLDHLTGGLVLLSEDGLLQCVYVGTHPTVYFVSPLVEPEIDFKKAESELKELQVKIKSNALTYSLVEDHVDVHVKINKTCNTKNSKRCCDVLVQLNAQSFLETLQVLIHVEWPLVCKNPNTLFTSFSGTAFVESSIWLEGNGTLSSVTARIIVTCVSNEGVAKCIVKKEVLPLGLIATESPPMKEASHKLNIALNKPVVGTNLLFKDLISDESQVNAVAIKYLNSDDVVTVLAAKSTQRYRIQSESLPALTLWLITLVERLRQHFRKTRDLHVTSCTLLPLDSYYEALKTHHKLVNDYKDMELKLLKECRQYRTIQKKILHGLKDATPKPSSNLHKLLADTSSLMFLRMSQLEEAEKELAASRCHITSLNRLMATLLKLNNIQPDNLELLDGLFDPLVRDCDDQGWLETLEATTSFLLRRVLTKAVKDEEKNQTEISSEPMKDSTKLIKHLSAVIDRFVKGTRLSTALLNLTEDTKDEKFYEGFPVGTKFANWDECLESEIKVQEEKPTQRPITPPRIEIEEPQEVPKETELDPEVVKSADVREERKDDVEENKEEDDQDDDIWNVKINENNL